MSSSPPAVVADRYRLVSPLGQGGMGRVWRATDVVLHRDVAIKELVPPPGLTPGERQEMRERSLREARAIARLNNVNVVRVFDVLRTDADPWIVMEYVPSRSLQDTLAAEGPYNPVRAAEIGLGVLGALRAAHRAGVVHRDVKPGNVLIGADGRVVLTDFGLATVPGDPNVTRTGLVLGSPAYIAPERARDGTAGPAADLWSLGATLYAAVEGASPFARPSAIATLAALATENPPPARNAGPLKPVLNGLLRKDPTHRINADEAERLLNRAAGRRSKLAFPMSPTMRRPGVGRDRPSGLMAPTGSTPVVPGPRPPVVPARPVDPPGRPPVSGGRPAAGGGRPPVYVPGKAQVGPAAETPTRVDGPKVDAPRLDATRVDTPPVRDEKTSKIFGTRGRPTTAPGQPPAAGQSRQSPATQTSRGEPGGFTAADVAANRRRQAAPEHEQSLADATALVSRVDTPDATTVVGGPAIDATTVVAPPADATTVLGAPKKGSQKKKAPARTTPAEAATARAAEAAPAEARTAAPEATPTETTPAEPTSAGTTPAEATPAETAQAKTTAAETARAKTTAAETARAKTTAAETARAKTTAAETAGTEAKPAEAATAGARTTATGAKPAGTTQAETKPAETKPAKATDAKPADSEADAQAVEAEPAGAEDTEAPPVASPAEAGATDADAAVAVGSVAAAPALAADEEARNSEPEAAAGTLDDSETASGTESETATGTESGTESRTGNETDAEPEPASKSESQPASQSGSQTETGTESDSRPAADSTDKSEKSERAAAASVPLARSGQSKRDRRTKQAQPANPQPAQPADEQPADEQPAYEPAQADAPDDLNPVSPAISRSTRPAWRPMEPAPSSRGGVTVFGTRLTYPQAGIGAGILLLVLVLIGVLTAQAFGDDDQPTTNPTAGPTTSQQTGAPQPSGNASTGPQQGGNNATPSKVPPTTNPANVVLPAGWRMYTQGAAGNGPGFVIPLPKDAKVSGGGGTEVRFRWNNRLLIVDRSNSPQADAYQDWKNQEASRRGGYRNYSLIKIKPVQYRDYESAADWEFLYTTDGGNAQHAVKRNIRVDSNAAYSLSWYTTPEDWAASQSDLQLLYQGFQPK